MVLKTAQKFKKLETKVQAEIKAKELIGQQIQENSLPCKEQLSIYDLPCLPPTASVEKINGNLKIWLREINLRKEATQKISVIESKEICSLGR